MKSDILSPILNSPKLPTYFAQIQQFIADEAQKRTEFYNLISEKDKAEFINGEQIMHSPVRIEHNTAASLLHVILEIYDNAYSLGYVGFDKLMIHLSRNSYEPDICFFLHEKSKDFIAQQMLFPAPDFVVEVISKSTEKVDRGVKMIDYALHGVQEYWLVLPEKRLIEKYILDNFYKDKYYLEKIYTIEDDIQSKVLPGLQFPVIAVFEKEENMKVVKAILNNEISPK